MPLLAEAWSDAHLNLDTLDADTRQAEAKLKKVVERLQRQLKLRLKVDKSDADRALADIERSAKQVRAEVSRPIDLSVTTDTTDAAAQGRRARDAAEAGAADDIDVTARVGLDDGATRAALDELAAKLDAAVAHVRNFTLGLDRSPFDADLAELQPALDYLNGLDVDIIARMDGDEALQAKLTSLLAGVEALDGRAITFRVDDNGVPRAEADVRRLTEGALTELRARLSALDRDVTSIDFDADPAVVDAAVAHIKAMVEELRGLTAKVTLGADDDVGRLALERYKAQLDSIDGRIIKARLEAAQTPTSHKNLQSFEREIKELTKGIKNVRMATDTVQANTLLDRFRVRLHKLTSEVYDAEVGVDDIVGQAKILELLAMLKHLDGMTADVQVDIDGAAKAIAELGAVGTIAEIVDKQKVNIGVDGTKGLNGLSSAAAAAASSINGLSGFGGIGGALFGMGGLIGLAAAFAAVIPGAIGAAVAFLGLGAAAGVAAGGFAAFALMTDSLAKLKIKGFFDDFKSSVQSAFQPITDMLAGGVIPAFLQQLGGLATKVAPFALDFITPIAGSALNLVDVLGTAITGADNLFGSMGMGVASLIDVFAKWLPQLTGVASLLMGPFFNALNGIVDLMFGTATTAAPVLAGALNAIGDGARALIDTLNRVVTSMREVFDFGSGDNPIATVLGQMGPIFETFATGIFKAVRLISDAVADMGLQNLINVLIAGFVELNPVIGAVLALVANLPGVIKAITPAVEALVPVFRKVGEVAGKVFEAALGFVTEFLGSVDFDSVATALGAILDAIGAAVDAVAPFASILGRVFGLIVGNAPVILGLLGAWAGFRLGGFISDLMGMSRMLVELVGRFTAAASASNLWKATLSSGSIVGQYKADLDAAVKGTQAAAGTAAATATANATAGAATKAANGIGAAGGAAVAATGAMSALSVGLAGVGAVLGVGLGIWSAYKAKQDASKQAVDALTDSILRQKDALGASNEDLIKKMQEAGRLGEINKSNVDLFGLSQWVNENAAAMDKLRSAMLDDRSLGGVLDDIKGEFKSDEIRRSFTIPLAELEDQINSLPAGGASDKINSVLTWIRDLRIAAENAGIEIPPAMLSIFTAVSSGGNLSADAAQDLINGLDDIGESSVNAGDTVTTAFNAIRAAAKQGIGGVSADIGITAEAFAKLDLQAKKDWVANYLKNHKELAEATGLTTLATDGFTEAMEGANGATAAGAGWISRLTAQYQSFASRLPGTARALDKWSKALEQGGTAAWIPDISKFYEAPKEATEKAVDAVHDVLSSTGLDSLFIIPDELVDDTESKAKQIQEAVQKFVGGNALSQFIDGAERNVVLALNRLVRSIDQKVKNIQRLKIIDAMGFSDLAAQLGSLNANPAVLGKYLDQLFAAGAGEMSTQNARLSAKRAEMEATLKGLSPIVAGAIGENFGADAANKIGRGSESISEALDTATSNLRLKANNIRRLGQLQSAGYGDLAVALAGMNTDPKKLAAALDQLAAGGVAAYQAANAKLAGASNELVAAQKAQVGPLAEALGAGTKEGVEAVNNKFDTIGGALEAAHKQFALENANVMRIMALEGKNYTNIAQAIVDSGAAPEDVKVWLDQLDVAGPAALDAWEAQLQADIDARMNIMRVKVDAVTAEVGQVVAAAISSANLADPWKAFFGGKGSGVTPKEGGDTKSESMLPPMPSKDDVNKWANDFADTLRKPVADASAGIGAAVGVQFAAGFAVGADGAGTLAAARTVIGLLASGDEFIGAGNLAAILYTGGVTSGVETWTWSVSLAASKLAADVGARGASEFSKGGTAAGLLFGVGVGAGISQSASLIRLLAAATAATAMDAFKRDTSTRGREVGKALMDGVAVGMFATLPQTLLAVTAMGSAISAALKASLGVRSPSRVGIEVGGFLAEGVQLGLEARVATVAASATSLGSTVSTALAQSLSPGNMGAAFGASLAAGIASSAGDVSAAARLLGSSVGDGLTVPGAVGPSVIGTIAAEQSDLARLNAAQQQTPQPATSPSTDVLLQQILAALRNLDASTDPMVLAMLQQILDGQQAPMTLDQHAAAAAMAKALSR